MGLYGLVREVLVAYVYAVGKGKLVDREWIG